MSNAIANIPSVRLTTWEAGSSAGPEATGNSSDFGAALRSAVRSAIDTGHEADVQAMKATMQGGNITEVATALARAELTLQTATAVRDRMLQAYQDIMRIQI